MTPNKEKPFIIHVNDVTIRVVGTSFNVSSINGVTEVIVETGIVQVTRDNNTVELKPKEKTVVKQADSLLTTQKEEEQLHQYYRTREFVCDGTPLWKLVDILNKAYDTLIVIENPKLRSYPLNTTFNNESLVRILEIIQLSFPDITINKKQDRIVLQ